MPRPFAAYLRVYEPLSAFGDPPDARFVAAVRAAPLSRTDAGAREEELWLKSQLSAPPRLLPGELPDGSPSPSDIADVLVLDPADVPAGKGVRVGPGPLVCPLAVRARSAAAMLSFLGEANPPLRTAALHAAGVTAETARARSTAVLAEGRSTVMHVLSVTWSIPLPWFALVDPAQRKLVLGSGLDDPKREVSWRVAMTDARKRVAQARELAETMIGEDGPARMLVETDRWLSMFDAHSAVELDYGGLVQLIPDALLESDTSADEVHAIMDALRAGDAEELTDLFTGLRDYWGQLAARERFN